MKSLSILGTAAMFTVGGGIIAHGVHGIDVVLDRWAHATGSFAGVGKMLLDAALGIVAGALLVALSLIVKKLRSR